MSGNFDDLGHFCFLDKYSRYLYDEERRETWQEAVIRTVNILKMLSKDKLDKQIYEQIYNAIYNLDVLPSMRLFSMSPEAVERDNSVIYNCAYRGIDNTQAIAESLYLGCSGVGFGYSVEKQFIKDLPVVQHQTGMFTQFGVADSQTGWAIAYKFLLDELFAGRDVQFDFSQIRPAGARLKTKGGYASGSQVLADLFEHTRKIIKSAQGRQLTSVEVMDIVNYVPIAAISGGSRRSALIVFGDADDNEFLSAKTNVGDKYWRYNSNNSAVWYHDTPELVKKDLLQQLYKSGAEPGILNRDVAIDLAPDRRIFRNPKKVGANPCFAPKTLVQTKQGHFYIEDLIGKTVDIWNGENWQTINNFRITGENQEILKITLQDGSIIRCTPYHRFILEDNENCLAEDLVVGDKLKITEAPLSHGNISEKGAYIKGFLIGDGTYNKSTPLLWVYNGKEVCFDKLKSSLEELPFILRTNAIDNVDFFYEENHNRYRMQGLGGRSQELIAWVTTYKENLPKEIFEWDLKSKCEFLAGLFDADGNARVGTNGFGYQLSSINEKLLLDVQLLLKTIGVKSKLALMKKSGTVNFKDGYGNYPSKNCYRLSLSQENSLILANLVNFQRLYNYENETIKFLQKPRFNIIVNIEYDGIEEYVYCCTVEGNHQISLTCGLNIGNCGEISLEHRQFCNLSTAVIRANDNIKQIIDKVILASIIGTIQSSATHFPFIDEGWKYNQEQDRLLGVCLTGVTDNILLRDANNLQLLRDHAVYANEQYADKLGIQRSVAVTSMKPAGNSSVLANTSPGANARHYKYAIRNVVVNSHTAIFDFLYANGVPNFDHPDPNRSTDKIFKFPLKSPDGALLQKDFTALEQCELWKLLRLNYTEHNVSISIQYEDEEFPDLEKWILVNSNIVNGMAFFKNQNYQFAYLPIQEINEEEYNEFIKDYPKLNWNNFQFYEHAKDERNELAECAGGNCVVSF